MIGYNNPRKQMVGDAEPAIASGEMTWCGAEARPASERKEATMTSLERQPIGNLLLRGLHRGYAELVNEWGWRNAGNLLALTPRRAGPYGITLRTLRSGRPSSWLG